MDYLEIYNTYLELKELLKTKKHAIIKKELENLHRADEDIVVVLEKIQRLKIDKTKLTDEQKQELKTLGSEIKKLEENNEILIKHSLDVINNLLSGILNIAQNEKCSYNSKGLEAHDNESLDISSITEEA